MDRIVRDEINSDHLHSNLTSNFDQNSDGSSAQFIYSDLVAHWQQFIAPGLGGPQQRANQKSALTRFLRHIGHTESDPIGTELNGHFEDALSNFLTKEYEGASPGTIHNVKSQLRAWKDSYGKFLTERVLPFEFLGDAFRHYFEQARAVDKTLTLSAVAKKAGTNYNVVFGWIKHNSKSSGLPPFKLERLEEVLNTPKGALQRFANVQSDLLNRYLSTKGSTEYGKRQAGLCNDKYLPAKDQITSGFRQDWEGLLKYKTAVVLPTSIKRHSSWKLRPTEEFDGPEWVIPYVIVNREQKQFAPTAAICFHLSQMFFGALAQLETSPGVRKYEPEGMRLAWMADFNLLMEAADFLVARLGGYTTSVLRLFEFIASLIHPKHGYIKQHPEFGELLPTPVSREHWPTWCQEQFTEVNEYVKRLKIGNHIKQTRDPFEPIWKYICTDHPIHALFELAREMQLYLNTHPLLPEHVRRVIERDLFMVELLTRQPLRIKMLAIMTHKMDNTGHLYRRDDGTYALRYPREAFKNERGAARKKYDVPFDSDFTPRIEYYLTQVRPWFNDDRLLVFVSQNMKSKVVNRRTNFLSDAFVSRTRQFLKDNVGFGPHSCRHLVATEYIKNNESGWQTAADVLHDELRTVLKHYSFLQADDGHKRYRSYLLTIQNEWRRMK